VTEELRELAIRILIACIAVTWLVLLWRGHRNPAFKNFSLPGLVMTKEGFIDRTAVMELGSWITMTLVLITLTAHDKLTETMAVIYVAFPAVRAGQAAWLRSTTPTPASTVTTEESRSTVITTPAKESQ